MYLHLGLVLLAASTAAMSWAKLPPPTAAQAQAAADKKAQAAAQAEKDKQALAASMDAVTARWRANASVHGKKVNPPTPVAAPAAAIGTPAAQSSQSGQPGGKLGSAAQNAPVKSEKSGSAPPSENVKTKPTGSPPGAS
jgi:colicin import membrane protein